MPRLPRFFAPGYPLHIIQRGNNRATTFLGERDHLHYLDLLSDAAAENGLEIHAFVMMSNHVHLLATPQCADSVPRTMQAVGRSYVLWFNRKYGRSGTLWEGRYRATVVDTDGYVLTCQKYIEENAVRAGMVNEPGAYRWSSFRANALGIPNPIVTPHPVYLDLGMEDTVRRAAYRRLFAEPLGQQELRAIREATNGAWALGSEDFIARIERACGRRASPMIHRPPRWDEAGPRLPHIPTLLLGDGRL